MRARGLTFQMFPLQPNFPFYLKPYRVSRGKRLIVPHLRYPHNVLEAAGWLPPGRWQAPPQSPAWLHSLVEEHARLRGVEEPLVGRETRQPHFWWQILRLRWR